MANNEVKTDDELISKPKDDSRLEAAMNDLENGRFKEFDSVESLMQDLNNEKQ